ncbi:hypothetical protein FO519_002218 [Halicephalobus sp. NKZ332]|nr:hypothetical protein FO519_002218 [Halicephalobus sp. NKZ332]
MADRREIYLGFPVKVTKNDVASLQRQYLPLGKIGGHPAWLNPTLLPSSKQIYCRGQEEHAFHRYLYVFVCNNPSCYEDEKSQPIRVFRCQLPLENSYFLAEKINFDDGEVPDPCFNPETFRKICAVCGCHATKLCGKCNSTSYCCIDHQKIDWKHHDCNPKKVVQKEDETNPFKLEKLNEFVFCEYGIELDTDDFILRTESDDESDEESDEEKKDDIKNLMKELNVKNGMEMLADLEENNDVAYDQFTKTLRRDPSQILRYDRHGTPLSATDHVKFPSKIPPCSVCKGPRSFEFQLTPHILSLIEERGNVSPVDFATVCVYTCKKDCEIPNNGYAEEYGFRQSFGHVGFDAPDLDGDEPAGLEEH